MLGRQCVPDVAERQNVAIVVLVDLGRGVPGLALSGASPLPHFDRILMLELGQVWEGACPRLALKVTTGFQIGDISCANPKNAAGNRAPFLSLRQ